MTKNKIITISLITFLVISALGLIVVGVTKNYMLKEVNLVQTEEQSEAGCGEKPEFSEFLGLTPKEMIRYDPSVQELDTFNALLEEWNNCIDMLSWKTYRNEEFGFEFRYPDEFNTEKQEPVISSGYDVESLSNDFKFVIKQSDNPNNLILWIAVSSREFLEFQSGSIVEPPIPSLEQWDAEKEFLTENSKGVECSFLLTGQNICRIIEKNGITMLDRIKLWPPGGDAGRYLTFYSDKFRYDIVIFSSEFWDILPAGYEFSFNGLDNPPQDSFIQLSNQILSTFKFVGGDETATWQTYRNEEFGFGFEFRYPASVSFSENPEGNAYYPDDDSGILELVFDIELVDFFTSRDVSILVATKESIESYAKKRDAECMEGLCPTYYTDYIIEGLQCEKYLNQESGQYTGVGHFNDSPYTIFVIDGVKACAEYNWYFGGDSVAYKEVNFNNPENNIRFVAQALLGNAINRQIVENMTDEKLLQGGVAVLNGEEGFANKNAVEAVELLNQILSTFKFIE